MRLNDVHPYRAQLVDDSLAKTARDVAQFAARHQRWKRRFALVWLATVALPVLSFLAWATVTGPMRMVVRSALNGGRVTVDE